MCRSGHARFHRARRQIPSSPDSDRASAGCSPPDCAERFRRRHDIASDLQREIAAELTGRLRPILVRLREAADQMMARKKVIVNLVAVKVLLVGLKEAVGL